MFIREALHALQFDNEHVFNQDICVVFSNVLTFVADAKWRLRDGADATNCKFLQPGLLVYLFEKSGAQDIGDFKDRVDHTLSERIGTSAFIGG